MPRQQINLLIEQEDYNLVKENRWHHNEIYQLGLLAKKNNPQIIDRFKALELRVAFLERQHERYLQRFLALETLKEDSNTEARME